MSTESVQTVAVPSVSGGTTPTVKAAPVVHAPPPAAVPAPAPARERHAIEHTLAAIAAQIESYLRSSGRSLEFSVDNASGRTVIAVRDAAGTLIRQIPSEEALELAHSIGAPGAYLLNVKA